MTAVNLRNNLLSRSLSDRDPDKPINYAAATAGKLFDQYFGSGYSSGYGSAYTSGYGYGPGYSAYGQDRRGFQHRHDYDDTYRNVEREESFRRSERERDRDTREIEREWREIDRARDAIERERVAIDTEKMYGGAYRPDMMAGAAPGYAAQQYGFYGPYTYPVGYQGATLGPGYGQVAMPPNAYTGYNPGYYDVSATAFVYLLTAALWQRCLWRVLPTGVRVAPAQWLRLLVPVLNETELFSEDRAVRPPWVIVRKQVAAMPIKIMKFVANFGFLLERMLWAAQRDNEEARAKFDRDREARTLARGQMEDMREQAREARLQRREYRREIKRRRRNQFSVSDDEVDYGTKRDKSSGRRHRRHVSFSASNKPMVNTLHEGPSPTPSDTTPNSALSVRADDYNPYAASASHQPPVAHPVSTGPGVDFSRLHPNYSYGSHLPMAPSERPASRELHPSQANQSATGLLEDYGNEQFAKEERKRAREKKRVERQAQREKRDWEYDQAHYGTKAYDPYSRNDEQTGR